MLMPMLMAKVNYSCKVIKRIRALLISRQWYLVKIRQRETLSVRCIKPRARPRKLKRIISKLKE